MLQSVLYCALEYRKVNVKRCLIALHLKKKMFFCFTYWIERAASEPHRSIKWDWGMKKGRCYLSAAIHLDAIQTAGENPYSSKPCQFMQAQISAIMKCCPPVP